MGAGSGADRWPTPAGVNRVRPADEVSDPSQPLCGQAAEEPAPQWPAYLDRRTALVWLFIESLWICFSVYAHQPGRASEALPPPGRSVLSGSEGAGRCLKTPGHRRLCHLCFGRGKVWELQRRWKKGRELGAWPGSLKKPGKTLSFQFFSALLYSVFCHFLLWWLMQCLSCS